MSEYEKQKHPCYIYCGSIYNSYSGDIIENPAIMVNKDTDCIFTWGNMEAMTREFDRMTTICTDLGLSGTANPLMLIEFSKYKINRKMACYIIRRAIEYKYTESEFIQNLRDKLTTGEDVVAWLETEMKQLPLDITEKES